MASGGDYGGIAQGGIGEGLAKGTQNFATQFQDAMTKKQQKDSQALNLISSNWDKITADIPAPDAKAPQADWDEWSRKTQEQANNITILGGQYTKLLGKNYKGTGLDPDSVIKAIAPSYNPKYIQGKVTQAQDGKTFTQARTVMEAKYKAWQDAIAATGDADSDVAKKAFADYQGALDDKTVGNGKSYRELFKSVQGIDYVDPTVDPAGMAAGIRSAAFNGAYNKIAQGIATMDTNSDLSDQLAKGQQITGNTIVTLKDGRQLKFSDYAKGYQTTANLDGLIGKGDTQSLQAALGIIYTMSDDDKSKLTGSAKTLWEQVQAGATPADGKAYGGNDALATAVAGMKYTQQQTSNAIAQGTALNLANTLSQADVDNIGLKKLSLEYTVAGQKYELDASKVKDAVALAGEAAKGNAAAISPGAKSILFASMPNATEDEKNASWTQVTDAYSKAIVDGKLDSDIKASSWALTKANLDTTNLQNFDLQAKAITSGDFYAAAEVDAAGNPLQSGASWDMWVKKQGSLAAAQGTYDSFKTMVMQSKVGYDQWDEQRKVNLQNSKAVARKNEVDATVSEATQNDAIQNYALNNDKLRQSIKQGNQDYDRGGLQLAIETATSKAKIAGTMGDTLSGLVDKFGKGVLNDPKLMKDFKDYYGAGWKNVVAGIGVEADFKSWQQQDVKNKSASDQFQLVLANPRAYDQATVKARAAAAGLDPGEAWATVTTLAMENKQHTAAELASINQQIWASKQGISLDYQRFASDNDHWSKNFAAGRSDQAFSQDMQTKQYWAGRSDVAFAQNMDGKRFSLDFYDTKFRQQLQQSQFNWGVSTDKFNQIAKIQELVLQGKTVSDNEKAQLMQFKATVLAPASQQAALAQQQYDNYSKQFGDFAAQPRLAALVSNLNAQTVSVDENGQAVVAESLLASAPADQRDQLKAAAQAFVGMQRSQNVQNNIQGLFSSILGQAGSGSNIDQFQSALFGDTTQAGLDAQAGSGTYAGPVAGAGVNGLKDYIKNGNKTDLNVVLAQSLVDIASGKNKGDQGGISEDGGCSYYARNVLSQVYKPQIVRSLFGGNANATWNNLQRNNLAVNGGKAITSVDQLNKLANGRPLVLFQNWKQDGHIAIYNPADGKIWQNSGYKDNKVNGAIGWMSPEGFLKSTPTFGGQLSDKDVQGTVSFAPGTKLGNNGDNTGGTQTPGIKTGINTGTSGAGAGGSTGTPDYTAPRIVSIPPAIKNYMTTNSRLVQSASPNGPLQVPVGNGSYRLVSNVATAQAVLDSYIRSSITAFDKVHGKGAFNKGLGSNYQDALTYIQGDLQNQGLQGNYGDLLPGMLKKFGAKK